MNVLIFCLISHGLNLMSHKFIFFILYVEIFSKTFSQKRALNNCYQSLISVLISSNIINLATSEVLFLHLADDDYLLEQIFAGCWQDSGSIEDPDVRDFHTYLIKDSYSLTVSQCVLGCRRLRYKYAVLQVKVHLHCAKANSEVIFFILIAT